MCRLIFLCSLLFMTANAFKILVLFPTPSFSHQRPIMALTEKLVENGHELFVVSPNKVPELERHDNYTFVDASGSYDVWKNAIRNASLSSQEGRTSIYDTAIFLWKSLTVMQEAQFDSEAFLEFEQRVKAEKIIFDIVIMETMILPYSCGMARKLTGAVPIIAMTSFPTDTLAERFLGNTVHMSFVPSYLKSYTSTMSLLEKMDNWFFDKWMSFYKYHILDGAARQYFKRLNGDLESLVDGCYANISLALVTSSPLNFYPRTLSPNVIETGPLHLKTPQRLPHNLQNWLDGADRGVIYFSLGSNLKSESMPPEVLSNFFKVFKELSPRYRIVWKAKFESTTLEVPQYILLQNWLPQQSILSHPKVKVFITQGGFQSLQEAMHYGVPTVGIPRFVDQHCHVSKMVDAGIGVRLLLNDLYSSEKIKEAIEEVLHVAKYSKNMKKMSSISHDLSSVALDTAMFWVEHVARHDGAAHLRPVTADTTLFEFLCLDIITLILVFSSCFSMFLYLSCKFLLRVLFRNSSIKVKES